MDLTENKHVPKACKAFCIKCSSNPPPPPPEPGPGPKGLWLEAMAVALAGALAGGAGWRLLRGLGS